ncbi:MAG: hypothetical protein AAGD25_34370 [Cyanobacteria bacterium P01_F01_bin.150]
MPKFCVGSGDLPHTVAKYPVGARFPRPIQSGWLNAIAITNYCERDLCIWTLEVRSPLLITVNAYSSKGIQERQSLPVRTSPFA